MLTSFQKAVLGTLAGAAVLIALVIAAKGSTPAAYPAGGGTGSPAYALPIAGGGVTPGIVTTGDATVKVKPDVAIITVGAVAQAPTAAEAQSAVARRVSEILSRAKSLGIADKDARNTGYSIQPQYAYGNGKPPTITGYQATQQIALTYRNVDGAGKALDTLVQGDAANTVSIQLTLDEPKAAQAEARKLAIQDARSKADAMAATAGVSLGKILAIDDLSASVPSSPKFAVPAPARSGDRIGTEVPTGDLDIVVRVQVQFAIQ